MANEKKKEIEEVQLTEHSVAKINRKENSVSIVTEVEKTSQDNLEMLEFFSEQNKIPLFKGTVAHAYESDFLGYKDTCPNCNAPTQQMMSNFAYGTQEVSRIMATHAGHFCTNCSTVIIDDDVMRAAIDPKFEYRGVFEIESGYEQKKILETLNGEEPIFIIDSSKANVYGIKQSVHQSPDDYIQFIKVSKEKQRQLNLKQYKKKKNNKRKNKAAKKARKSNRRK